MKYGKLRMCLLGEDMFQSHASPIFMNIGDAVQGVAMSGIYQKVGIQGEETILLPRFSLLKHFSYPEAILLPYGSALSSNTINKTLPFPECIHPIFVSINAGSDFLSEDTGLIEYFKKHAPIGCRDEKTRNYFRRYGIRAYIMGCYTMTLDPPQQKESPANDNDTGKVITVDLSEKALQAIPDWIKRDSISMTHNEPFKTFPADETEDNRFYRCAKEYLGIYAAASLVITSRLHVAAPCIAMGVPVVLMSDNLDYRFEWIDKYIPCYQSSDYSKIDWLNIRAANKEDVAFAKKTLIDLYGAIISQNDYEPYLEALDNFYNDPKVVMPTEGSWYTIMGVNDTESQVAYLAYDGTAVTLTSDAKKAAAFLVNYNGEDAVLSTVDGKYLHILTNNDTDFVGTTSKNITTAKGVMNNLKLAKLVVEDADNTKTFGKFSITGLLGLDATANAVYSTATINYLPVPAVADVPSKACIGESVSSAFKFVPVSYDPTQVTVSITPEKLENNTKTAVLTVNNVIGKVTLVNQESVTFINAEGETVSSTASAILTAVTGSDNQFTVRVNGLPAGTYTLNMPSGTFVKEDGSPLPMLRATIVLSAGGSSDETYSFSYTYQSYSMVDGHAQDYPLFDVSLNKLILFHTLSVHTGLVCDPTKTVALGLWDDSSTIVSYGHFQKYDGVIEEYPWAPAIELVLDEPIEKGSIRSDRYGYLIPAATFGDANFEKWLAGDSNIRPEDCIVNPRVALGFFYVNNDEAEALASGINDINADSDASKLVYDLQGRKVEGKTLKSGIYIKNGKKVYIK